MAVVVENQERRLLDEQPRDVVEPEVRPAEEAAGPAQVEPVERPALAQQVAQVAAPQVGQRQVAQQLDRRLGVAAVQRRAIEVILVEQTNVPQEGQLAVLEQDVAAAASTPRRLPVVRLGEADRRRSGAAARGR